MGGTRLLVGAGLVVIGWGATGGLLGGLVSTVLGLAIALGMTGRMHGIGFGARRQGVDSSEVYVYFWPVLISCAVIAVMMNADVMIVKKFFAGEQAGVYSKASLIARMIAYVSGPIVVAMAPKVAGQVAGAAFAARTFLRAVALCVLVTVCASGVCWLFPSLPLRILADSDDAALYPLVRLFVWAFAPMPVLFMLINFLMARTSFRFLLVVAPLSLAYVVSLWLRHPSYEAIVTTLGFAGLLVTLITAGFSWREIRRTDAGAVSGG
jgi:O-antigen/teichoic acid export membrane protein